MGQVATVELPISRRTLQRLILAAGAVVFIWLGLEPPWVYTFATEGSVSEWPGPSAPLLNPPLKQGEGPRFGVRVDHWRLMIEWILTLVATASGWYLAGQRAEKELS